MTDNQDTFDISDLRAQGHEDIQGKEFATVTPAADKNYEQIDTDLGQRHRYGEQAAKQHAKEALEELYSSDFPIDDPPESFERYEAEMTVRHLRGSIEERFQHKSRTELYYQIDGSDGEMQEVPEFIEEQVADKAAWDNFAEEAKRRIDVMATYGDVAESHIAALTIVAHSGVRKYATETLAEMREEEQDGKSLTAAIRDWWRDGG